MAAVFAPLGFVAGKHIVTMFDLQTSKKIDACNVLFVGE